MSKKPIIYVDMDGVLVDLYTFLAKELGVNHYKDISRERWDEHFSTADAYELFRNLPPFENANDLLRMVVSLFGSYKILSSPLQYDKPNSVRGKEEWLHKYIEVPSEEWVFEHEKYLYAKQADGTPNVLIDDFRSNIEKWQAAGGIGIKYQGDEQTLEWLEAQLRALR